MKKLVMIVISACLLIITMSSALAVINDTVFYYTLDVSNISGTTVLDESGNSNDGTLVNSPTTDTLGVLNRGVFVDGSSSQEVRLDPVTAEITSTSDPRTISLWANTSWNTGATQTLYAYKQAGAGTIWIFYVGTTETINFYWRNSADSAFNTVSNSTSSWGDKFKHISMVWDGSSNMRIYIDGVLYYEGDSTTLGTRSSWVATHTIGQVQSGDRYTGYVDEIAFYDRNLSASEINNLYTTINPYNVTTPPAPAVNYNFSTVGSSSFSENNRITVGNSYGIINTVTVTNENNNTPYYATATFTTNASSGSTAECRILLDGVERISSTRTLSAGTTGNFALMTTPSNLTNGNHTYSLECQKTGGSNYAVESSELNIIHLYDDQVNQTIVYNSRNGTGISVTNTITALDSYTITTSNTSNTTNEPTVIVQGRASYVYTSTNNISTWLENVNTGEVCGNYTRYGSTGSTGSVATNCLFQDLEPNTQYNFTLYGVTQTGTGSLNDVRLTSYQILTNNTATNNSRIQRSLNAAELTNVANITIANILGGSFNVHLTSSIMVQGNSSSQESYWYLSDGSTNSITYDRTLSNAGAGNIFLQDTIAADGTSTKTYSLYGYCPDGCEVIDGQISAFVTDADIASTGTFTIQAFNQYNNSAINTFTATVGGATYNTNNGTIVALGSGTVSVTVNATNFFINTTSVDTSTTALINLTPYLEIRANQYLGASVDSFTVNTSTDSFTTANGVAYLPITANTSVTINSDDIAGITETVSKQQYYNFTVYAYNSLYFEFRDTITGDLVNNVTLQYFSDNDNGTNSTTTGSLYLTLLQPEFYIFTYNSTGYDTNYYFLTIANDTYNNVTLYLNNDSSTTDITVQILDGSSSPLENAVVQAQKHFISTNEYKTVASGVTNPEGETVLPLITENEFYKFTIVYNDETVKVTNPFIITGTTIKIQVFIGSTPLEDSFAFRDITGDLTLNEESDNFRYTFSDSSLNNREYCLYVYRKNTVSGNTLYDSSCTTGSSGTILISVENVTGRTYLAEGYVNINGEQLLASYQYTYGENPVGTAGLVGVILLLIVLGLPGFLQPELLFITVPLGLVITAILGLHSIPYGFTVPLVIVGVVLMIVTNRQRGGI